MTSRTGDTPPDEAELTAWLDGRLTDGARRRVDEWLASDAATRDQLAALQDGARPFREAFDALLGVAPRERLMDMFEQLQASQASRARAWRRAATAAAILVAIGASGYIGRATAPGGFMSGAPAPTTAAVENWRDAVAGYFRLQTPDTLASVFDDPAMQARELASAGARLGIPLSLGTTQLPELWLRRADLYQFRGMPLSELLYAGRDGAPIAFCAIANGLPDAPIRSERRGGFNIVFWQRGGRGYLVIGAASITDLRARADLLKDRFGA